MSLRIFAGKSIYLTYAKDTEDGGAGVVIHDYDKGNMLCNIPLTNKPVFYTMDYPSCVRLFTKIFNDGTKHLAID